MNVRLPDSPTRVSPCHLSSPAWFPLITNQSSCLSSAWLIRPALLCCIPSLMASHLASGIQCLRQWVASPGWHTFELLSLHPTIQPHQCHVYVYAFLWAVKLSYQNQALRTHHAVVLLSWLTIKSYRMLAVIDCRKIKSLVVNWWGTRIIRLSQTYWGNLERCPIAHLQIIPFKTW